MNDDTADVDRLFARLSGEAPHRDPDDHPAPEKLSAYLANELSPEEDGEIQEHLAQCTLCTELLLDLQRFLDLPAEDLPREGVADFETAAGWRDLKGRMGEGAKPVSERPRSQRTASLRVAYSLAAVLALAVVGLGMYVVKLQDELRAPRAGNHIFLLASETKTRGSANSRENEFKLHETPDIFSMTLDKPPEADFPDYVAEISPEKAGDKQPQRVKGLHYQKGEGVTLLLSKDGFKPGTYKIVLLGLRGGQSSSAATYSLSVLP